jgi:hypothetical protein
VEEERASFGQSFRRHGWTLFVFLVLLTLFSGGVDGAYQSLEMAFGPKPLDTVNWGGSQWVIVKVFIAIGIWVSLAVLQDLCAWGWFLLSEWRRSGNREE